MLSISRTSRNTLASVFLAGVCAGPVHARPNGFAVECGGCHYGQLEGGAAAEAPTVTASASATRVEPGETVDLTVTVENNWADALVAGFLVMTQEGGGAFTSSEEDVGNVGLTDGQPLAHAIGHTAARTLAGGTATFQTTWTAPTTSGAYEFAVYAVTSDDGDGQDDPDVAEESNEPFGKFEFTVAVGCDLLPFYRDADMDGFGSDELLSCDAPNGYVAQAGDCKDDNPAINPGAEELCSFADENCDGESMSPPTFYRDADGDGYGAAGEISVDGCEPPAGYAARADDCATADPAVNPGATELPGNGVDDNCNGTIDEGTGPEETANPSPGTSASGVGTTSTSTDDAAGSSDSAVTTPTLPAPEAAPASGNEASSGCGVVHAPSSELVAGLLGFIGAALMRRRHAAKISK